LEIRPVILSAAKDLASLPKRSFAALRMTASEELCEEVMLATQRKARLLLVDCHTRSIWKHLEYG